MSTIERVCVIGAGVMGAGIAAHVANAGADVILLDVVEDGACNAIDRMKKTDTAPYMHPQIAQRITPGCTQTDLTLIKDCDWVIEAIIEKPDIKQDLYHALQPYLKKGAALSSNTSTLPLKVLVDGLSTDLQRRFMITHFFNPPRYLRLLEIVSGPKTDPTLIERVRNFADIHMGKTVINAKDTPGFIANRIGTFWLHAAVTEAVKQGITVEAADAVLSRPAGVPKTGVFGLLDLVGLDLMPHVLGSFEKALPPDDPFHALGKPPDLLTRMIKDGSTGRKGKGGFYRLTHKNGKKIKEVIDLSSGTYAPAQRPKIQAALAAKKGGLRATLDHDSTDGKYARSVLVPTLAYACALIPEIADDPYSVDQAMKLGYAWKQGPFEMIDKLGADWLAQALQAEGKEVPAFLKSVGSGRFYRTKKQTLQQFNGADYNTIKRSESVLLLEDIKRKGPPLMRNISACVWDLGDGVACLEFTSKMNSLDPFILWMMGKCTREIPKRGFKGLVIHNEGPTFSVGANIAMLLFGAKLRLWPFINAILRWGQNALKGLKYAPFPVVGAPSGMALGGGCEVLLHCDAIEAHSETYVGLVEVAVGIIPGWGGCKELLIRHAHAKGRAGGPMPPVMKSFETIALASVAKSAAQAKEMMFLRPHDSIVMNKDRVLWAAKARVLDMAPTYQPPEPTTLHLPGPTGRVVLELGIADFVKKGVATPHDATIARQLAQVLSGGQTDMLETLTEDQLLKLERNAILTLAKTPQTRARVAHMLTTGRPLRN